MVTVWSRFLQFSILFFYNSAAKPNFDKRSKAGRLQFAKYFARKLFKTKFHPKSRKHLFRALLTFGIVEYLEGRADGRTVSTPYWVSSVFNRKSMPPDNPVLRSWEPWKSFLVGYAQCSRHEIGNFLCTTFISKYWNTASSHPPDPNNTL